MMSLNGGCSAGAVAFFVTVFFSLGAALALGAAFSLGAAALRLVVIFFSTGAAAAFFARAERFGGWFSASDAAAGAGDDAVAGCSTSGAGLVAAGADSGAGEDIVDGMSGDGKREDGSGAFRASELRRAFVFSTHEAIVGTHSARADAIQPGHGTR